VIGLIDRQGKFVANEFKTKAGNDIRNIDLVRELLMLLKMTPVTFVKIKAHQKATPLINYNIEVDKLARKVLREEVSDNE